MNVLAILPLALGLAAPAPMPSDTPPAFPAPLARLAELNLIVIRERARQQMLDLTVYITTLAMTFLTGKKRLKHRRPSR